MDPKATISFNGLRQVSSAAATILAQISYLVRQHQLSRGGFRDYADICFQEFAPVLGTVEDRLLCFSYPSPVDTTAELEDDGSSIFAPSRFSFQFFIQKPSPEKSVKIQSHEYSAHSVPYEKISIQDPSKYA
ncbi:hypothetical protein ACH5RR_015032 [Cinchona calisaya]|uniref:Uncharacterized protein n=1 Tax=Cinchona calisaya TaxID=153742 RepID=A0ABD2ZX90_9GENT